MRLAISTISTNSTNSTISLKTVFWYKNNVGYLNTETSYAFPNQMTAHSFSFHKRCPMQHFLLQS